MRSLDCDCLVVKLSNSVCTCFWRSVNATSGVTRVSATSQSGKLVMIRSIGHPRLLARKIVSVCVQRTSKTIPRQRVAFMIPMLSMASRAQGNFASMPAELDPRSGLRTHRWEIGRRGFWRGTAIHPSTPCLKFGVDRRSLRIRNDSEPDPRR